MMIYQVRLYTILYYTILYCTVLYCTVLYCTVLYCTVLYCTINICVITYNKYTSVNESHESSQKYVHLMSFIPSGCPKLETMASRVLSLINDTSSMALVLFPGMFTGMDAH